MYSATGGLSGSYLEWVAHANVQVEGVAAGDMEVVEVKCRSETGTFVACEDEVRRYDHGQNASYFFA